MAILCLGEALVDLVCERPVDSIADADSFVPHAGGAVSNAAIVAVRCGAQVELAGAVGTDGWGDWLTARLRSEGVGLQWFKRIEGLRTPLAFVTLDRHRRPDFLVYDETIPQTMVAIEDELGEAVDACEALYFGSNTLVGAVERQITESALSKALEQGKPVLFDPNFRLHRWPDRDDAVRLTRAICSRSLLVKVNHAEVSELTGLNDPSAAAELLVESGAQVVVVTLGERGAIARGAVTLNVKGVNAQVVDTTGAGDVIAGILIAALSAAGYDPQAVSRALSPAVTAASRSTEGWGAVDALPDQMPSFA